MSLLPKPLIPASIALFTFAYAVAYLGASSLDLLTTHLALLQEHAAEGNPFAVANGTYSSLHAWLYTTLLGPVIVGYAGYGIANLHRVTDAVLRSPLRSYAGSGGWLGLTILVSAYFVPKSDRAALHTLSAAIAFVVLGLLAAANNTMIALWGDGFLSALLRLVTPAVGSFWAFVLVMCGLYAALIVATAKVLARQVYIARRSRGLSLECCRT